MKKLLFTEMGLKTLGFTELEGDKLDNGYYRWWVLYINDHEIHITYEYNAKNEFIDGYVKLNGETLKGREITIKDITFLIELL